MHYIIFVGVLLLFSTNGLAQNCQVKNSIDILRCGLKYHPMILKQEENSYSSEALRTIANQVPNPSFESSLSAQNRGGFRTEFGLSHTIERGGKKDSRISVANSEYHKAKSELAMIKSEVFVEIWQLLHELRQLKEFIELASEIAEVYDHSLKNYNSRKWVSKNQALDRDLIKLAKEEIETRIVLLKITSTEKRSRLMYVSNTDLPGWNWLPTRPKLKPLNMSRGPSTSYTENFLMKNLEISKNRLQLERSNSVNDLNVGPIMELENTPSENLSASFGVQLSMNIPFFHQNAGQIEYAQRRIEKEVVTLNQWKRANQINISSIKSIYENSIKRLAIIYKNSSNNHFHVNLDQQSKSGLLSPTTVTEAHRQIMENLSGTHVLEMKALMAKWQFKQLNGTLLNEVE